MCRLIIIFIFGERPVRILRALCGKASRARPFIGRGANEGGERALPDGRRTNIGNQETILRNEMVFFGSADRPSLRLRTLLLESGRQ